MGLHTLSPPEPVGAEHPEAVSPARPGAMRRAGLVAVLISIPLLAPLTGGLVSDAPEPAPLAPPARVVPVDQPAPASRPVGLRVPAIGLTERRLVDLGLDADGELEAPQNFARVGWFTEGPAPGDPGPAVLVGHVDSKQGPAVFFRLRELERGDEISVPRADGSAVRFVVNAVERYPKDDFPTERVYGATADPQLRLITCGGAFDRSARSYRDNVVVYASINPADIAPVTRR